MIIFWAGPLDISDTLSVQYKIKSKYSYTASDNYIASYSDNYIASYTASDIAPKLIHLHV